MYFDSFFASAAVQVQVLDLNLPQLSRILADKSLVDQNLSHLPQLGQPLLVDVEPTRGSLLTPLLLQQMPANVQTCQQPSGMQRVEIDAAYSDLHDIFC